MSDDESLTLHTTVIAGIRYADDYAVVWRGLSIGRIMKAHGRASAPSSPSSTLRGRGITPKQAAKRSPDMIGSDDRVIR